ncbi:MAG: hypothetical protein CM1200mP23_0790 [Nitrososphaerota archaeon]|nr:MAG: hypothetical protein CM1200mP23_0790 [Nitrososphaerota archaeon]
MVDIALDVFNYIFTVILIGVFLTWISLIFSMYKSFTRTPYLDKFGNTSKEIPKVSIILPARNEEKFIGNCLESFVRQDYTNYEIITVDDSSDEILGRLLRNMQKKVKRLFP